jgi:ArsR family transcriptional regulator, arsenate/arsenite/antimonite-responsive transcriptional repressor
MAQTRSEKYDQENVRIARLAKALSHPARLAILELLARQDACFCGDIVEELPIAQATVSQHLKELKTAGLIQGDIKPPKVRYCIDPKTWEEAKVSFGEFFQNIKKITEC